ncbi:MAG: DUF4123 domain-containing protein [Myxococcales bacterium]|nr:DUF4123 domain-containing protein [Myxococcales bacterium]
MDDDLLRAQRADAARSLLAKEPHGLFAVLDAARDPRVLTMVGDTHLPMASLYDGVLGDQLADVAPYLVQLSHHDDFFDLLVSEAWGDSWGVFLRCDRVDFRDLRRHLRRFLRVRDEAGARMLFRFYDPRVLRAFLPVCTVDEATQLFGPIDAFLVEGWEGESLLRITQDATGVRVASEPL